MGLVFLYFLIGVIEAQNCSGNSLELGAYGTLQFKIDSENVSFSLQMKSRVWIAIGFGQGMSNVDMAVTSVIFSRTVDIYDYYSQGYSQPESDKIQNLEKTDQWVTDDGGYVIKFSRRLKTGDSQDTDLIPGTNVVWGWAAGSTPSWEQANIRHQSQGDLKFFFGNQNCSKPSSSKKSKVNLTKVGIDAGRIAGENAGELAGKLEGYISAQQGGNEEAAKVYNNYPKKNLNNTQVLALSDLIYGAASTASKKVGEEAGSKAGKIAGGVAGAKAGAKAAVSQKTEDAVTRKATKAGEIVGQKAGKTAGHTAGYQAGKKAAKIALQKIMKRLPKK